MTLLHKGWDANGGNLVEKYGLEWANERTSRGVEGFNQWIFDILNFDRLYWKGEGSLQKRKAVTLLG